MRAIAEGFVGRLTAAAEGILRLCRVFLSFPVIEGFALGIGGNPLLAERQAAADEVGTVFGDFDFRVRLFTLIHSWWCMVVWFTDSIDAACGPEFPGLRFSMRCASWL